MIGIRIQFVYLCNYGEFNSRLDKKNSHLKTNTYYLFQMTVSPAIEDPEVFCKKLLNESNETIFGNTENLTGPNPCER